MGRVEWLPFSWTGRLLKGVHNFGLQIDCPSLYRGGGSPEKEDLLQLFGLLKRKQDNSRESASLLFPSLSSQLKRKKDHGKDLILEVPFSFRMCFSIYVWKVMMWFYNVFSAWRTCGSTPYSGLWERDFSAS